MPTAVTTREKTGLWCATLSDGDDGGDDEKAVWPPVEAKEKYFS